MQCNHLARHAWRIPCLAVRVLALVLCFGIGSIGIGSIGIKQAHGYLPEVETIWEWVENSSPVVTRAILTAQITVFAKSTGAGAIPKEIPSRSWQQRIYWIAGQYLGVESLSDEGRPLHIYVRQAGSHQQRELAGGPWDIKDIQPPYLDLLTNKAQAWQEYLGFWGINPRVTQLAEHPKLGYLLLLGDSPTQALWLNQAPFRAVRLESRIKAKQGFYDLVQHYDNFLVFTETELPLPQRAYFPSQVSYTLNGILFKQFNVLSFIVNPPLTDFPIARLQKEVADE